MDLKKPSTNKATALGIPDMANCCDYLYGLGPGGARVFILLGVAMLSIFGLSKVTAQPAGELLLDGDFGSLTGWNETRIPFGYIRELVAENSPFEDVYAPNDSSLKLGDNPEITNAHVKYLNQSISGATRTVGFGVDFKILPDQSDSFVIQLRSGEVVIFNLYIRSNVTVNMHIEGDSDGIWTLPGGTRLEEDVWHQFQCTIDMNEQLMTGTIISHNGDNWDLGMHRIAINTESPDDVIDFIQIGASSGSESHASPVLLDNITLRAVEIPR